MMVREQSEQHCGGSAAIPEPLDSLLSSSILHFVHGVARLLSNEISAHHERLTIGVAPVSDSLELDSPSIVDSKLAAEQRGRISAPSPKAPRVPLFMSMVPPSSSSATQP